MQQRTIGRIGVVGLGRMGLPIARHLRAGGYAVTGYDISAAACARAGECGIAVAPDLAAVASASDFVIVVVGFDAEVEQVVSAPAGLAAHLSAGAIVAVASTVAPYTMTKLDRRLADRGIALLDIPLCRGERAAEDGELLVMAGGSAAAFAACRPALACFATDVFHLGEVGAGQVGKMVNNLLLWACISINHEGLKLAERLGVDPELLRPALVASSASNWALATRAEDRPIPWAEKDMTLVLKEADRARVSLPLAGTVKEVIKGIKIARGLPTPADPES